MKFSQCVRAKTLMQIMARGLLLCFVMAPSFAKGGEQARVVGLSMAGLFKLDIEIGSNLKGLTMEEIPAALTTITKEEIKLTGAKSIPDLLTILIPGYMNIQDEDDNIHGFRGLVQDNNATVLMLVNGQNVGYVNNYGLNTHGMILDLNYVSHIEVVSGPGFADFGQGPLLGVINVVTEDFEEIGSYAQGTYSIGSAGYHSGFGKVYTRGDGLKAAFDFSYFEQKKGYKLLKDDKKSGWIIPDAARIDKSYHDEKPGYAFHGLIDHKGWNLAMYKTEVIYDVYHSSDSCFQHFNTLGAKLKKRFDISEKWSLTPTIHGARVGIQTRQNFDFDGLDDQIVAGEQQAGGKMVGLYDTDNLKVAIGSDVTGYDYGDNPFYDMNYYKTKGFDKDGNGDPQTSELNYSYPNVVRTDSLPDYSPHTSNTEVVDFGAFTEAYFRFLGIHSILLSGRVDYSAVMEEVYFSPKITYNLKLNQFYAKALVSSAYRPPMPEGRDNLPMAGFWRHYSNPGLKTQQIINGEIHAGYKQDNISTEVRYFIASNNDIIQGGGPAIAQRQSGGRDADSLNAYYGWTFANAGDVLSTGVEAWFEFQPIEQLKFKLSHAFAKPLTVDLKVDNDLFVSSKENTFINYPENVTRFHITGKPWKFLTIRSDMLLDYGRMKGNPLFGQSGGEKNKMSDVWFNWNLGVLVMVENWEFTLHGFNILNQRPFFPLVFKNDYAWTPEPFQVKASVTYKFKGKGFGG